MQKITVVQGLLIHSNKKYVLMQHRPIGKKKPLLWEYPGGKVDPEDSSLQNALIRELEEELCIKASIGPKIKQTNFQWQEDVDLHLFAVHSWVGEPMPLVATEIVWVDPRIAIDWMPLLPGAYAAYREVISYLDLLQTNPHE